MIRSLGRILTLLLRSSLLLSSSVATLLSRYAWLYLPLATYWQSHILPPRVGFYSQNGGKSTNVRYVVKQSIAIQRILPFWQYLQADDKTPKGALILHWITSVIFIAAAPTHSDGYSFAIGIYTYGHILISSTAFVDDRIRLLLTHR